MLFCKALELSGLFRVRVRDSSPNPNPNPNPNQALEQSGLAYVAVDPPPDGAGADRPDSPPPLTDLFPEMRCYVFDIRCTII